MLLEFLTDHLLALVIATLHLLGILASFHVLMHGRTAQGTIAWLLSLTFLPYVTVPLFLLFGSPKFTGYLAARRSGGLDLHQLSETLHRPQDLPQRALDPHHSPAALLAMEQLAQMPFTRHNRCRLLIDGQATFNALFAGIEEATDYLLVQFFIIRDDELGRALAERLCRRARAGVRVYFLYDGVGCKDLPWSYIRRLEDAGIEVSPFSRRQARPAGLFDRLRLNFRNHRKIVVADGYRAWVGGHNVGVEYQGRHPRLSPWRDTHVQLDGPAALACQVAFVEDWHWATGGVPALCWQPRPAADPGHRVLIVPSGPADELETCALLFVQAINSARRRLWIVSPYFVPDAQVVAALQLAVLRGVDVRILLPDRPDHLMVWLASYAYLSETDPLGIKLYRYRRGFLHQKVVLIDDDLSLIGTANFDNRSFRINFEITVVVADGQFVARVATMLENDFAHSVRATLQDYLRRPLPFRLACRAARLLAPIL
ncbi:MAG: cardiolipin synthase [Candidatus Competibacterales bacterium]|nr:cardiolipin synthase [Candidatus Competibacterales bacterium]